MRALLQIHPSSSSRAPQRKPFGLFSCAIILKLDTADVQVKKYIHIVIVNDKEIYTFKKLLEN